MPDTLIPCAKGCGHDVVVPEAQMQLMAGVPGAPIIQHDVCPVDDVVTEVDPNQRTYTVLVAVTDDEGDVVRFEKHATARSFLEATGLLGPLLSESWKQVLEHAAKVDVKPRETGSP